MILDLYGLAGLATFAWLLLIVFPSWRVTRWLAESSVAPVYLCVLYAIGIVRVLGQTGPGLLREFGSAEGVLRILTMPDVALVAWIHILAFDQLVGLYVYRDNLRHRYVPLPIQSLILLLTFMLGPLGFLLYFVIRASRRAVSASNQDTVPIFHAGDPFAEEVERRAPTASVARAFEAAPDTGLDDRVSRLPSPIAAPLAYALAVWTKEERSVTATGLLGILLGAAIGVFALVRGPVVEPEGVLSKPMSFDVALGIYTLTLALFLPLARFRRSTLIRWRGWTVVLTLIAYGIETIQALRGLDPRFSNVAVGMDQSIGIFFFLVAVAIMGLFWVLGMRFFDVQRAGGESHVALAIRYAVIASLLAFAAGFAMSFNGGRYVGQSGNWMALHALGFHGLQAVPIIGLLVSRSGIFAGQERRWIHAAGWTWVGACAAVGAQTLAGLGLSIPTLASASAAALVLGWLVVAGAILWRGFAAGGPE